MDNAPYVLRVELPNFYVQDGPDPTVIVRDQAVLATNKEARRRGIRNGMHVRQASAIAENCKFKLWSRTDYEERQWAWLDLCLEFTGVIEPDEQHSAWLDLSLHPKPIDIAERLIRTLSRKTGHVIRHGSGPSKWISTLAVNQENGSLADKDPCAFLASLPTSLLLPVSPEHRERLHFLGYCTVGQVAALPLSILQEQFEEEAFAIHSAARGSLRQFPIPKYPRDSIRECFIFDGPAETLEVIQNAVRVLSSMVGDRLSKRNLQSGKLQIVLELEGSKTKNLSRIFTTPLCSSPSVENAIHLLIRSCLDSHLVSIQVTIPELKRLKVSQSNFPLTMIKDSKVVAESVERVRNAFGERSVLLGSELKQPRRVNVLREWKHATGWQ